jgi:hypothetical protein
MLPEPRESAPAAESGCAETGELVLGEAAASFSFGVGGVGSGVVDSACFGWVLALGMDACRGALPGE